MKLCRLFRLLFGLSYVICVMSQFSKKKGFEYGFFEPMRVPVYIQYVRTVCQVVF